MQSKIQKFYAYAFTIASPPESKPKTIRMLQTKKKFGFKYNNDGEILARCRNTRKTTRRGFSAEIFLFQMEQSSTADAIFHINNGPLRNDKLLVERHKGRTRQQKLERFQPRKENAQDGRQLSLSLPFFSVVIMLPKYARTYPRLTDSLRR